jgi:hypothetical protein
MKKNYLLLIMTLIIISCSDNDSISGEGEYYYTFSEKSNLKILLHDDFPVKYGVIESGENIVFEYRFDRYDDPLIYDDEYSEFIQFEIDSELENFSYSNEELLNIDLVFSRVCQACNLRIIAESNDVNPTGIISGEKISNKKWKIKMDFIFYGYEPRTIEKIFELK